MRVRVWVCIAVLCLPIAAWAQGFAGLGTAAEGYASVRAGTPLTFPKDHGPHNAYRIEWWYLTANITDEAGAEYGVQFTLFRQASAPPPQREGWASQQFWLGHAALTTADQHLYAERFARGGSGQAGAIADPFNVWIDEWQVASVDGADGLSNLRLFAGTEAFSYDLALTTARPLVLQGEGGYSVKSDRGQASYYYSQPYFTATGTLTINGQKIAVSGASWMDREWSNQPLAPDQSGWDWFSIHLDAETKLMLFRLRAEGGDYVSGNWIEAGASTRLSGDEIEMIPREETVIDGRTVPTAWTLRIPSRAVDLAVAPLNAHAWNGTQIGYWEGPVRTTGSHNAVGYLEMTGY